MAGHDPDDGQGNRRHDDQRRDVAAELRHHQQVDQDQADAIGRTHITEGLIGDLPLAVPLDGVGPKRVTWLADPVFANGTGAGQGSVLQMGADAKQPIQR